MKQFVPKDKQSDVAEDGLAGPSEALPHLEQIQGAHVHHISEWPGV